MLRADGTTEQLTVAHVDPAKVELARELRRRYPPDFEAPRGLPQVLRTGQPELVEEVSDTLLVALARDEEHLRIVRELGLTSAMIVPLVARERILGAITLVAAESGRRYGAQDLAFAEELARRAALAIDNARLYREAREAIGTRDEFLSIASHELRTPLTVLSTHAQMLQRQTERGQLDPALVGRSARAITDQSNKLVGLILQLLDVSRMESGKLQLEPERVDLVEFVKRYVSTIRAESPSHPIRLEAPERLEASLDPLRFEQVLTNLVDNAIKYSPEGGPIEVGLRCPSPELIELAVQDRGLGIPPEQRGQIFERFFQAHGAGRRGGLGLGLYISRQIVELHGGQIWAEFPERGGSHFVVRLPSIAGEPGSGSQALGGR
jgi:signal transduction histidine kinase